MMLVEPHDLILYIRSGLRDSICICDCYLRNKLLSGSNHRDIFKKSHVISTLPNENTRFKDFPHPQSLGIPRF